MLCYVAFALNRISLIGKEHGNLVKLFSKMRLKKFILVSFIVCLMFSTVKFFKYAINRDQPEANYPMSTEWDISAVSVHKSGLKDAYFIVNTINDLICNVVFVLVCSIIDFYMVVFFRRTLQEKLNRIKHMSQKNVEDKRKEYEMAVQKAVKMVVINTAVGLIFKLPISIPPFINTYAEFYYKDQEKKYTKPSFGRFYTKMLDSGFYELMIDLGNFLFLISISIQFFLYKKFDKKFLTGLKRLRGRKSLKKFKPVSNLHHLSGKILTMRKISDLLINFMLFLQHILKSISIKIE